MNKPGATPERLITMTDHDSECKTLCLWYDWKQHPEAGDFEAAFDELDAPAFVYHVYLDGDEYGFVLSTTRLTPDEANAAAERDLFGDGCQCESCQIHAVL